MKNKILAGVVALSAVIGLAFAGSVSAASAPQQWGSQRGIGQGQFQNRQPGVFGTVSAINGTNLTVQSKGFGSNTATTTYSVDASNATVMDKGATSTLSEITVGNTVFIQGTVSGTSVTATKINVGMGGQNFARGMGNGRFASSTRPMGPGNASSTNMIQGNGEPVIGGTVSAISGTTITITNKGNTNYTIDASSATITKENSSSSISDIAVGDNILVQGTINGTSITATSVIDQVAPANDNQPKNKSAAGGFLGEIKNFFSKLFGF